MDTERTTDHDGTRPNPPLIGSLVFLLLNLPLGIAAFVFVVVTLSVGVGTVIIWVGLAVLAVAVFGWRGFAQLERTRVHAMLGTYIAPPYRPAPETGSRWVARLKDPATWKDMAYCVLLLPIGIAEFVLITTFWAVSLWLTVQPVIFAWLPDSWQPVMFGHLVFHTWAATLPWAALGVLFLAMTVALTRALGILHARYARAILGPSTRRISRLERLSTAGAIDWSTEWPNSANMSYRPVSQ